MAAAAFAERAERGRRWHSAQSMMTPRQVPWVDWAEWAQVRDLLCAANQPDRARGVQRVAAWRSRGRLPVSVESTACLVEIWLSERAPQPPSEVQLRLAYSMALLRMVNGICDPSQRGKAVGSVLTLSRRLGLPPMLVDLRHAATHGSLPALPALQLGATQAMGWLLERYWRQQHEQAAALEADETRGEVTRGEVTSALKKYRKAREAAMQKQLDLGRELSQISQNDTEAVETRRTAEALAGTSVVVSLEVLVEVLLDGSMLAPKAEKEPVSSAAEQVALVQSEVDGVFNRLRSVWRPMLTAVRQRRPRLRGALLGGVITRLVEEPMSGEDGEAAPAASVSSQQRLRLGLLQRWAQFLMSTDASIWPPLIATADTAAKELDLAATVVRCLKGVNEWVSPLLSDLQHQQSGAAVVAGDTAEGKLSALASFGSSMAVLRRDPALAASKLNNESPQPLRAGQSKPAAAPQPEAVASTLEQWRQRSAQQRRELTAEGSDVASMAALAMSAAPSAAHVAAGVVAGGSSAWSLPDGYTAGAIGAPVPATAGQEDGPLSLELPEYINTVSLHPSQPALVQGNGNGGEGSHDVGRDAFGDSEMPQRDGRDADEEFMGVDAFGSYSLPAPTAFDGSSGGGGAGGFEAGGGSLGGGGGFGGGGSGGSKRLLSAADIELQSAGTNLVECL